MNLLLDTHLLLWAAGEPKRLSAKAKKFLQDENNILFFSAASIWEVAIKSSIGREDFNVEARLFRRGLLDNGYNELPITGEHAVAIETLPVIHKDPFDRTLIAQSQVEGIRLLTTDASVVQYKGLIVGV